MKKLLAGLLAAVLLTAPAFGDDTVWDSLEDRYYEDISQTETDITLRFLEEGDQLDWSRAVRRYHTEDSRSPVGCGCLPDRRPFRRAFEQPHLL